MDNAKFYGDSKWIPDTRKFKPIQTFQLLSIDNCEIYDKPTNKLFKTSNTKVINVFSTSDTLPDLKPLFRREIHPNETQDCGLN